MINPFEVPAGEEVKFLKRWHALQASLKAPRTPAQSVKFFCGNTSIHTHEEELMLKEQTVSYTEHVVQRGQESQQARGTARGGGAEAMFMLLPDTEGSWRLQHTDEGGNR